VENLPEEIVMNLAASRALCVLKFLILPVFVAASDSAMAGMISGKALARLHIGQTEAEVIRQIGKPAERPNWLDGTHSLVYSINRDGNSAARVYVDIGTDGRVLDIQYGDDGDSN